MDKLIKKLIEQKEEHIIPLSNQLVNISDYSEKYLKKNKKSCIIVPVLGAIPILEGMKYVFEKKGFSKFEHKYDFNLCTKEKTDIAYSSSEEFLLKPKQMLKKGDYDYNADKNYNSIIFIDEIGSGICWCNNFSPYKNNFIKELQKKGFEKFLLIGLSKKEVIERRDHYIDRYVKTPFKLLFDYNCDILEKLIGLMRESIKSEEGIPYGVSFANIQKITKQINSAKDYENNLNELLNNCAKYSYSKNAELTSQTLDDLIGFPTNKSLDEKINIITGNEDKLTKIIKNMPFYSEKLKNFNERKKQNKKLCKVKKRKESIKIEYFNSPIPFSDTPELIGFEKQFIDNVPVCEKYEYEIIPEQFRLLIQFYIDKKLNKINKIYYESILSQKFNEDKEFMGKFKELME